MAMSMLTASTAVVATTLSSTGSSLSTGSSSPSPSSSWKIIVHCDPKLIKQNQALRKQEKASANGAQEPSTKAPSTPTPTPTHSRRPTPARSFEIAIHGASFHPICDMKRAVALHTGIPPHIQRLAVTGDVDNFAFPCSLTLTKRLPRQETISVHIKTYLSLESNQQWTLTLDPTDTVLDVKFLLAPLVRIEPEFICLYGWRNGERQRHLLNEAHTLTQAGVAHGSTLRVLFELPSEQPGHGRIHRASPTLLAYDSPDVRTIGANYRAAFQRFATRNFLGSRSFMSDGSRGAYEWLTYSQVGERVDRLIAGFASLGLAHHDRIGVMSVNRSEWVLTDAACACNSWISVPLYDTLGPDAVEFIINHAQVRVVVVARANLKQIASVRSKCPTLQYVVLMDDGVPDREFVRAQRAPRAQLAANAQPANALALDFTHAFSEIERIGADRGKIAARLPKPEDTYTICYTSGTTGSPKGAVITHANMLAATVSLNARLPASMQTEPSVLLSYLPLAHIYERLAENGIVVQGHAIGFSQGDTTKLVEDVAELKPSLFPGVPRVWQRMYDRIRGQVGDSNAVARYLYDQAYASKLDMLRKGNLQSSVWDKLVFSKIAQRFGGRLQLMVSGAAPLSSNVAEFLRLNFLSDFVEGYGLTETCACLTIADVEGCAYGIVGLPMPCNEVKLVDVPDMSYFTTDKPHPRGEIWVRGPNVFSGYYRQPELSAECITPDGWFMTGDVGMWLNDGSLKIIDRKKNLFKLSQGEYIRPEHIEGVYKQHKLIANIFVHGDSTENFLVAIVVPDFDQLATAGFTGPREQLANDPAVLKAIQRGMDEIAAREKLRGFELVRRIKLVPNDFSIDNGLLTPTFKLKRHAAQKMYEEDIAKLYKQPEALLPAKL